MVSARGRSVKADRPPPVVPASGCKAGVAASAADAPATPRFGACHADVTIQRTFPPRAGSGPGRGDDRIVLGAWVIEEHASGARPPVAPVPLRRWRSCGSPRAPWVTRWRSSAHSAPPMVRVPRPPGHRTSASALAGRGDRLWQSHWASSRQTTVVRSLFRLVLPHDRPASICASNRPRFAQMTARRLLSKTFSDKGLPASIWRKSPSPRERRPDPDRRGPAWG